jgi:hypothetical protein
MPSYRHFCHGSLIVNCGNLARSGFSRFLLLTFPTIEIICRFCYQISDLHELSERSLDWQEGKKPFLEQNGGGNPQKYPQVGPGHFGSPWGSIYW